MESEVNKIYIKYFELIDDFFGSIKHHLNNGERGHINLGLKMASYPLVSDLILDAIDDLSEEINKFWTENTGQLLNSIKESASLKCLYSGDITPASIESFIKRSSLYIDTIILPDPLFNLAIFQKEIIGNKKYYLQKLIQHVFNIWRLKDLILADTKDKIVIIFPINLYFVDKVTRGNLLDSADVAFTSYINKIFNNKLSSKQECFDFLSRYDNTSDIFKVIKDSSIFPNKLKDIDGFNKFFQNFNSTQKYIKSELGGHTLGWDLSLYINSQFVRVQEHRFFCNKLVAEPIYDYDLAWFWFNYEMGGLDMDASIANALQKEDFDWIGNSKIPILAFKKFREENKLDYMRAILRQGITDLKTKTDADLVKTAEQLEINFKEAFKRQRSETDLLKKEASSIAKEDVPITIGGFLAGFIPYPYVGNIVSIITAGRDIKNLFMKRKNIKKDITEKENSFINLLMKSHGGKE